VSPFTGSACICRALTGCGGVSRDPLWRGWRQVILLLMQRVCSKTIGIADRFMMDECSYFVPLARLSRTASFW
jgi:hypothetical protein